MGLPKVVEDATSLSSPPRQPHEPCLQASAAAWASAICPSKVHKMVGAACARATQGHGFCFPMMAFPVSDVFACSPACDFQLAIALGPGERRSKRSTPDCG